MKMMRWFALFFALMPCGALAQSPTIVAPWGANPTVNANNPYTVTTSTGTFALPAFSASPAPPSVNVCNTGSNPAYVVMGAGPATAGSSLVAAGICKLMSLNSNTSFSAIATGGNTTLNVETGAGSPQSSLPGGAGGGTSGFPITLGSTSIAAGSTTTSVTGLASIGITGPVANTTAFTLSGASHTGSDQTSDFVLSTTWNTSGTPTAAVINVTNTASGIFSKILDIQVGGASLFSFTNPAVAGGESVFVPNSDVIIFGDGSLPSSGSARRLTLHSTSSSTNPAVYLGSISFVGWASGADAPGNAADTLLSRGGVATLHLGVTDATVAIPQTLGVQGVVAGTTNAAGANFTIAGSQGTGTGAGGSLIFQTAPVGLTGTAQNALATVLTLDSTKLATFTGQIAAVNMTQTATAQSGTVCQNTSGTLTYDATVACLTSAETLKDISGTLPHPLATILALRPIAYAWKSVAPRYRDDPGNHWGLGAYATAYEGEELIARDADGNPRGWRTDAMIATTVGAIQELDARIAKLEYRGFDLERK